MKKIFCIAAVLLSGCVVAPPTRVVYVQTSTPPFVYQAPPPQPVVSIYVDPPLFQPPPIRVAWAPPPMLVEVPLPLPYGGAIWTGGYWVWEGDWIWARGRWIAPPRPGYGWINPYYENRGGSVIFVNGFWAAPGVSFVAPSLGVSIAFGVVAAGVIAGPRPIGPEGVFIPPPPGSHVGLIVPAPIGTSPAVVTSAPPIIRVGMHVSIANNNSTNINININNNTTSVANVTNVTIVAPANATANGQAVNASVPAQAQLAAAMQPVVRAFAPVPVSATPIPALVPGRPAVSLPVAQVVHSEVAPTFLHQYAAQQMHQSAPQAIATTPQTPAATAQASAPIPSNQNVAKSSVVQQASIGLPTNQSAQQPVVASPQAMAASGAKPALSAVKNGQSKANESTQKRAAGREHPLTATTSARAAPASSAKPETTSASPKPTKPNGGQQTRSEVKKPPKEEQKAQERRLRE